MSDSNILSKQTVIKLLKEIAFIKQTFLSSFWFDFNCFDFYCFGSISENFQ